LDGDTWETIEGFDDLTGDMIDISSINLFSAHLKLLKLDLFYP